jgi:pyruvate/2-oxoacid:ferredoxin oxidoreductase beta subunit
MNMNKLTPKLAFVLCVAALLSACVTINIYFPAAAAEKAADKIIDEVWQLKQGQPGSEKDGAAKPDAAKPATPKDAAPTEPAAK